MATDRPSPSEAVAQAFDRIAADARDGIWIELVDRAAAMADASRLESALAGGADLPLAGVTLAVKNNIDVRGIRTTAACKTFGRVPTNHAPVVQALVDAGAVVIGVTNLDQFATGLVGTRSPYGICPNAHWPGLISGGSSSGSAVAVAAGHVDLALGTDTAGSGRVPAAANGIIGVKPTKARVSTEGIVPASPSFDCPSLFGRDVESLRTAFGLIAEADGDGSGATDPRIRLAIPRDGLTFDGDSVAAGAFEAAVDQIVTNVGGSTVHVDLEPFIATGRLLYESALVRERYDAVGRFIEGHPDDTDPIVSSIIRAAGDVDPGDLLTALAALDQRRALTASLWKRADVLVVPSVPRLPTVAEVQAEPIKVNAMLGTYTNFVNLLGLCAVTIPVGDATADKPPTSITLIAPAGFDERLMDLAAAIVQPSAR